MEKERFEPTIIITLPLFANDLTTTFVLFYLSLSLSVHVQPNLHLSLSNGFYPTQHLSLYLSISISYLFHSKMADGYIFCLFSDCMVDLSTHIEGWSALIEFGISCSATTLRVTMVGKVGQ